MSLYNIPRRGGAAPAPTAAPTAAPSEAPTTATSLPLYAIPPRPGFTPKPRSVINKAPVQDALAFNKSALREAAKLQARNAPPVEMPIPEAQLTGLTITVKALLEMYPLPPLPTGEPFVLHDWQINDIETCLQWWRVGVFLPVGAGKTVIGTYVALGWGDEFVVVLVPPILVRQWEKWINSIKGSGGALAYKGSPKVRHAFDLKAQRWLVMSDQIFKNDFSRLVKTFRGHSVTLLKDEAQGIKNSGSQLWKLVNQFTLGQKLMLMTGTEMNKPGDAYGYIKLKTPGVYSSYGMFKNIHVLESDHFDQPIRWGNLDLLQRNLYLQSVQRTKEQVHAHLPKAHYIPLEYELDPAHLKLYNELVEQRLLETESGGKFDATSQQALYTYSQQIVLDWASFSGRDDVRPAGFDVIDMVAEQIDLGEPGASKLIVWTWFKPSTKLVSEYLKQLYPGRVAVAYSDSNSVKEVQRFMEDPNCVVLVAQPLSAGAGLNPQYICWNALFLEIPTVTIPFRQSAGRIDREGQKYNANIWIAQAVGTIQQMLYQNLLSNDALVQKVQGNVNDLRRIIHGK